MGAWEVPEIDSPFGRLDSEQPPPLEQVELLTQWQAQEITRRFTELLQQFVDENMKSYVLFMSSIGGDTGPIWRAFAHMLRAAAEGFEQAADANEARGAEEG